MMHGQKKHPISL